MLRRLVAPLARPRRLRLLQNSRQFGQTAQIRRESLQSQFGQKCDVNSVGNNFTDWLRSRLGPLTVAVLNAKVNGEDIAMLIGDESLGRPTRNKLRTTLQAIKQAAWEHADGDASLRSCIEELLDQDKQRAERMRVAGARAEA